MSKSTEWMPLLWPELAPKRELKLTDYAKLPPKKSRRTSRVLDYCGKEICRADFTLDEETGQVSDTSITWDSEEEESDWDGDWDSVKVKPAVKSPKCKPCRICHIKHFGNCHKCPHKDNLADFGSYEKSPCSDCGKPNDGLKNGHGKGFVFDADAHGGLYVPHEFPERDQSYEAVLDTLRAFASLTATEFSAYINVHYFSQTHIKAGESMEKIFQGRWGKNKVESLLKSAEEKLSEVLTAGKIHRGRILGQV